MNDYQFAGLTDPGKKRKHNEDAIAINANVGIAILADGMGGRNAGEVASALAVTTTMNLLETAMLDFTAKKDNQDSEKLAVILQNTFITTHQTVARIASSQPRYLGMGTTLIVLLIVNNTLAIAHVGDSRAYQFRENKLKQITTDHSVKSLFQQQASEEQPCQNNLITQAIGLDQPLDPQIELHQAKTNDGYLLCSDGLTDCLTDTAIEAQLREFGDQPNQAVQQLIDAANQAGARDNVSAIYYRHANQRRKWSDFIAQLW